LLFCPYKAMLLRLRGGPSHFRRNLLTLLKALDCGDWDLVDQERPEDPREDALLVYPGLELAWHELL